MSNSQSAKHSNGVNKVSINKGNIIGKRVAIIAGIVVALLVLAYLAGVLIFSKIFLPNTYISNLDISLKSPSDVSQKLDDMIGDYAFNIEGQGLDLTITSAQAGISIDSNSVASKLLSKQNAWGWPISALYTKKDSTALTGALSQTGLADIINQSVATFNETATQPTNASVKFDDASQKFVVVPETVGTALDSAKVLDQVIEGALALKSDIVITSSALLTPAILSTDALVASALSLANADLDRSITITYNGSVIETLDKATIASWVSVSPDLQVVISNDAVDQWASTVAEQFNTVGVTRIYTRPDGKTVSVSGGDYGWKIDSASFISSIDAAVDGSGPTTIELPVLQSADVATTTGNRDFGSRYIDVDLTEQHARFYDESGNIIWESDVVSGEGNSEHATPQGTWSLNLKQSPSTLIGEMTSAGVPEYKTVVQYWMPFEGNAVGFHDATWQSAFGGTRYLEGYGSHGCINLPLDKAADLYNLIQVGDVVVVHE